MTFPDETIDWARKKLQPLFRKRGAPETLGAQKSYAAAILRIAHPGLVALRVNLQDFQPTAEQIEEALIMTAEELSTVHFRTMGVVANPFDWLVTLAEDESRFFIEPVDMRLLFLECYPCADGRKKVTVRGEKDKQK